MKSLNQYKYVFLDCDGVILDSNNIKANGFYEATKEYSEEHARNLVEYHKNNGGITRALKFKYFFEKLMGKNVYEKEFQKCLNLFEKYCWEELKICPYTNGFEEFFKSINDFSVVFIVSGAPEVELKKQFELRGNSAEFAEILGAPKNKKENVELIKSKYDVDFSESLFIGDSHIDYETAEHFGIDFIFMSRYTQFLDYKEYFKDKPHKEIRDFTDLI